MRYFSSGRPDQPSSPQANLRINDLGGPVDTLRLEPRRRITCSMGSRGISASDKG